MFNGILIRRWSLQPELKNVSNWVCSDRISISINTHLNFMGKLIYVPRNQVHWIIARWEHFSVLNVILEHKNYHVQILSCLQLTMKQKQYQQFRFLWYTCVGQDFQCLENSLHLCTGGLIRKEWFVAPPFVPTLFQLYLCTTFNQHFF